MLSCQVIVVPFLASILTFFSGFGLGTILLPVFSILFPVELAVAMTAVVHFVNNLFKLFLIGKNAEPRIVLKFGLPAVFSAAIGAWFLTILPHIHVVIGILMIFFALMELVPRLSNWTIEQKYLPLGGLLSGFFGGLSGHQGAFRSAFLLKAGLKKHLLPRVWSSLVV